MSKGGAGKVYFVLYLAVILELLIIFIERDEAEEHLRRQQREAIQIVQTILSQLQTGAGATAITTRPKDNITLSDKDPESTIRVYDVLVAVGDSNSVREGGVRGDDIPELTYVVTHMGDPNIPEEELPLDTMDLNDSPIFEAVLGTANGGYFDPKQVRGGSIPTGDPTAYFQLNEEMTAQEIAKGRRVKVFRVNFKPSAGEGWYRLRFESKTNQIMGVVTGEPDDDDTVRIGNVKLTVKQLKSVKKFMEKEKGEDESQKQVMSYINALLDPEAWKTLQANQGANAIDVRVVRPDLPPPAEPVARINFPRQDIYWYTGRPFEVPVTVGPSDGGTWNSNLGAIAKNADGQYELVWSSPVVGDQEVIVTASNGGMSAEDRKTLHVEKPELAKDWKRLPASRATIGTQYRPETEWKSTQIPQEHYRTIVKFGDKEVFSGRGTKFDPKLLPPELNVSATSGPIYITVEWLPNGDIDKGVPILSTEPASDPIVAEYKFPVVNGSYKVPNYDGDPSFTFTVTTKKWDMEWDGIRASQQTGPGRTEGVSSIDATCSECAEYGLSVQVRQIDDMNWKLFVQVADRKTFISRAKEVNGKAFNIDLTLNGKGSTPGIGTVQMNVRLGS